MNIFLGNLIVQKYLGKPVNIFFCQVVLYNLLITQLIYSESYFFTDSIKANNLFFSQL